MSKVTQNIRLKNRRKRNTQQSIEMHKNMNNTQNRQKVCPSGLEFQNKSKRKMVHRGDRSFSGKSNPSPRNFITNPFNQHHPNFHPRTYQYSQHIPAFRAPYNTPQHKENKNLGSNFKFASQEEYQSQGWKTMPLQPNHKTNDEDFSTLSFKRPSKHGIIPHSRTTSQLTPSSQLIKDPSEPNLGTLGRRPPLTIDSFELGLCSREDRHGKLFPARHKITGFLCSIKIINKHDCRKNLDKLISILKLQMLLNNEKILKLYSFFEDAGHLYLLLQYSQEGELYNKLKTYKGLQFDEVREYILDLCEGLNSIHQFDWVLRSIKPENISIVHNVCKISYLFDACPEKQAEKYSGTIEYMAPEILKGEKCTKASDIWSLGILVYEMVTGGTPFQNKSKKQAIKRITECSFCLQENLPLDLTNLLECMLQLNPSERSTACEIRDLGEKSS